MTDEPTGAPRSKRRISPLVILVVVIAALIIVLSGVGFYVFSSHVGFRHTTPAQAAQTIAQIRARFAGQTPLITMTRHGSEVSAHVSTAPGPEAGRPITNLRIVAFDPHRNRLVRITIPFWLLKWKGSLMQVRPFDGQLGADHPQLTVQQLQRHGPGLILDFTDPRGAHVVMWAEGSGGGSKP